MQEAINSLACLAKNGLLTAPALGYGVVSQILHIFSHFSTTSFRIVAVKPQWPSTCIFLSFNANLYCHMSVDPAMKGIQFKEEVGGGISLSMPLYFSQFQKPKWSSRMSCRVPGL